MVLSNMRDLARRLRASLAPHGNVDRSANANVSFNEALAVAEELLTRAGDADGAARHAALDDAQRALAWAAAAAHGDRRASVSVLRVRGTYEWLRGNTRAATKSWTRSIAEGERLGLRHEAALGYLEAGRRTGDAAYRAMGNALMAELDRGGTGEPTTL